MTEEITNRQTSAEATGAVRSAQQGITGQRAKGAERKPMISWAAILQEAVTKPGYIHEAYSRFRNFSIGNQILALYQCVERSLPPGPLATFPKWKELGRHVKKGEKALHSVCRVTCRRKARVKAEDGTEHEEEFPFTHFIWRAIWFTLAQTQGAEYKPQEVSDWNEQSALTALKLEREEFQQLNGNVQGYAKRGRKIAVSPIAAHPFKTLFHEIAHILMHVEQEGDLSDSQTIPHALNEVEAEAVALLCCESLGLPGAEFSRGYIQSWGQGQAISERSAQRIFRAADQILRAGQQTMDGPGR